MTASIGGGVAFAVVNNIPTDDTNTAGVRSAVAFGASAAAASTVVRNALNEQDLTNKLGGNIASGMVRGATNHTIKN